MGTTNLDARQIEARLGLPQTEPGAIRPTLDNILLSVDSDLTAPLRVDASATPNLTVTIGPGIVSNAESNRQRTIPFVNGVIPTFTGGTITFPAFNGGTIIVSPGTNVILDLPVNTYADALLSLNNAGQIVVLVGTPNATQANVQAPPPPANTLPFAYVQLFNSGGTVQNITQNTIFQLDKGYTASTSSSSSGTNYLAGTVAVANGSNTVTVNFTSIQPDISYVVFTLMENTVDPFPQFLQPISMTKTTSGFLVALNGPTDSPNYKMNYLVPARTSIIGEVPFAIATSTSVITLGIPEPAARYGVLAMLQNLVDASPQIQPVTETSQNTSGFSISASDVMDTANYTTAYAGIANSITVITNGTTSITIPTSVGFGTTEYSIAALTRNFSDPLPQFQPLLVTARTAGTYTISWSNNADSANYSLASLAISLA
jgi:hypothetical protein